MSDKEFVAEDFTNSFKHHGVKGMKWGHRKDKGNSALGNAIEGGGSPDELEIGYDPDKQDTFDIINSIPSSYTLVNISTSSKKVGGKVPKIVTDVINNVTSIPATKFAKPALTSTTKKFFNLFAKKVRRTTIQLKKNSTITDASIRRKG